MPTPREWLDTLVPALDARWAKLKVYDAYYEGDQELAIATRRFRDAYGGLFSELCDNWMQIVVDSPVERLRVQGFRFGEQDADDDAWDIWQTNGLDGESNMLHTEAVKLGWSYWMVGPGDETPRITAEHPSQVICYTAPGDRRERLSALKKWRDGDWVYANVYLPDRIVKYRTSDRQLSVYKPQDEKRWETVGSISNPLGVVPVIPVMNNPSMLYGGRSELSGGVLKLQDAINLLVGSMLIGAEFQAYPQRVLLGVDQPLDPSTGKPIRNFEQKVGQSRLLMFPNENAKVEEWSAADLSNFQASIQGLTDHLAAQTRTPPHYVVGKMANMSGDALKAAETGLVSKVRDKMDPFGEAHEEAIRLAFRAQDPEDERAEATDCETIWRDPESRSEAETVDAAIKLRGLLPDEIIMERIGMSPQEIDRAMSLRETDAFIQQALAPPPAPEAPSTNGTAPPVPVSAS